MPRTPAAVAAVADLQALARAGRARTTAREHALAVRQVAGRVDSDAQAHHERAGRPMSPERREELGAQYLAAAQSSTRGVVDSVRQQATTAAHVAGPWIDEDPAVDPATDGAREQRMAAAWARYRPLLDAGHRPDVLIADAQHPDDVRALLRELPAHLTAQQSSTGGVAGAMSRAAGNVAPAVERVQDLAARRLAVLAPGDEGERLRARHVVADAQRVITLDLEHAEDVLRTGSVGMAAGFAGQQARADADDRRATAGMAPLFAEPAVSA